MGGFSSTGVESGVKYCCGDEVRVRVGQSLSSTTGVIKFIGVAFPLGPGEFSTRYGIECAESVAGGHDGNPSKMFGRRMFKSKKGCGVLVLKSDIESLVKEVTSTKRVTVGDYVTVRRRGVGVVLFVGTIDGTSAGEWFGVDLLERLGKHKGLVNEVQYFRTSPAHEEIGRHGVHVREAELELLSPDKKTLKALESECAQPQFEELSTKDATPEAGAAAGEEVPGDDMDDGMAEIQILPEDDLKEPEAIREERLRIRREEGGSIGKAKPYCDADTVAQMATRQKRGKTMPMVGAASIGLKDRTARSAGMKLPSKKQRRFRDCYDCDKVRDHLGDGEFGSVFKCYSKSLKIGKHRRMYAMKRINKLHIMKQDVAGRHGLILRIRDEIRHLKKMRRERCKDRVGYRNVMQFVDAFEDPAALYIVSNYCNGGTLYDYVSSRPSGSLDESACQHVIKDVLQGLKFLNSYNIAHLDLNPNNVMVVRHPTRGEVFQLIDFGMARVIPRMRMSKGAMVGTPHFIAPEVLTGVYSPLADIWSVGVIMFLLLHGYPPFFDSDPKGIGPVIFRKIKSGFTPKSLPGMGPWFPSDRGAARSDGAKDLITQCLQLKLDERISIDDALDHRWLKADVSDKTLPHAMHTALVTFTKQCKFRLLVSRLFADELTADERKRVRGVFTAFDTDGDGTISLEEFITGMTEFKLGYSTAELSDMFKAVDVNGDGSLDLSELMTAFSYQSIAKTDAHLVAIFKKLDADGTGFITSVALRDKVEEMKCAEIERCRHSSKISGMMGAAGAERRPAAMRPAEMTADKISAEYATIEEAILNAIAFADSNGDGKVSLDEFMASLHPELHEGSVVPAAHRRSPTVTATFTFMRMMSETIIRRADSSIVDGFGGEFELGYSSDEFSSDELSSDDPDSGNSEEDDSEEEEDSEE